MDDPTLLAYLDQYVVDDWRVNHFYPKPFTVLYEQALHPDLPVYRFELDVQRGNEEYSLYHVQAIRIVNMWTAR